MKQPPSHYTEHQRRLFEAAERHDDPAASFGLHEMAILYQHPGQMPGAARQSAKQALAAMDAYDLLWGAGGDYSDDQERDDHGRFSAGQESAKESNARPTNQEMRKALADNGFDPAHAAHLNAAYTKGHLKGGAAKLHRDLATIRAHRDHTVGNSVPVAATHLKDDRLLAHYADQGKMGGGAHEVVPAVLAERKRQGVSIHPKITEAAASFAQAKGDEGDDDGKWVTIHGAHVFIDGEGEAHFGAAAGKAAAASGGSNTNKPSGANGKALTPGGVAVHADAAGLGHHARGDLVDAQNEGRIRLKDEAHATKAAHHIIAHSVLHGVDERASVKEFVDNGGRLSIKPKSSVEHTPHDINSRSITAGQVRNEAQNAGLGIDARNRLIDGHVAQKLNFRDADHVKEAARHIIAHSVLNGSSLDESAKKYVDSGGNLFGGKTTAGGGSASASASHIEPPKSAGQMRMDHARDMVVKEIQRIHGYSKDDAEFLFRQLVRDGDLRYSAHHSVQHGSTGRYAEQNNKMRDKAAMDRRLKAKPKSEDDYSDHPVVQAKAWMKQVLPDGKLADAIHVSSNVGHANAKAMEQAAFNIQAEGNKLDHTVMAKSVDAVEHPAVMKHADRYNHADRFAALVMAKGNPETAERILAAGKYGARSLGHAAIAVHAMGKGHEGNIDIAAAKKSAGMHDDLEERGLLPKDGGWWGRR